jgi:outer membrane protein
MGKRIFRGLVNKTLVSGLALLLFSTAAIAEKIGYVDARRLIDESPQGQSQLTALEDEFELRSGELQGKFDVYKAREAEFQKNAVLMSDDEVKQKTAELRELQRELKRTQRDYNEEYSARRNESLAGLQNIISQAVIFLAERDNYDLIVQQAVYASKQINLTDLVLEELIKRANQ